MLSRHKSSLLQVAEYQSDQHLWVTRTEWQRGHHAGGASRGHGRAPATPVPTHSPKNTSSSHLIPASRLFPLIFQSDSYHYPHPASTRGRLNPKASKTRQKPMSFYIGEAKPKSDSACWPTTDGQARGSRGVCRLLL